MATFRDGRVAQRVTLALLLSSWTLARAATLALIPAHAKGHEVQPSVVDLSVGAESVMLDFEAALEPFIAGSIWKGQQDTDASALSDEVVRLRALPSEVWKRCSAKRSTGSPNRSTSCRAVSVSR